MLLYLSMFTLGFWAGTILTFKLFAAKKPEEEERLTENYKLETINQLEIINSKFLKNHPIDLHSPQLLSTNAHNLPSKLTSLGKPGLNRLHIH